MEDQSIFNSQPKGGISEDFRQFIKETIEEVVVEGRAFDGQKRWLRRFGEAEGVDCNTLERNMADIIEVMEEWKQLKSKSGERMARMLGKECYLTEQDIDRLLQKLEGGSRTANPTQDASMMGGGQSAEDEYISECIKEVCIKGDLLSKYRIIIEKKFGIEYYQKCEGFVEEVKRSMDKKKFTKTSVTNLHYLARQIGVSDATVDAIVKHYTDKFEEEGRGRECQLLGVLVLDGSGSMEEKTAQQISKAKAVTLAVRDLFSHFKASSKRDNFNFAIVNYDHRSIVRMQPTRVMDIDDHGNYNPMKGLGGATYISEGLKPAKKIAEDFLNQSQKDVSHRHVVVTIMTDGIDMTQPETIGIVNALKRMDNVKVTGCFFETVGADAKATDEAADYIKSLCSEERLFDRVSNVDDLKQFFIKSMSQETPI